MLPSGRVSFPIPGMQEFYKINSMCCFVLHASPLHWHAYTHALWPACVCEACLPIKEHSLGACNHQKEYLNFNSTACSDSLMHSHHASGHAHIRQSKWCGSETCICHDRGAAPQRRSHQSNNGPGQRHAGRCPWGARKRRFAPCMSRMYVHARQAGARTHALNDDD